MTAAADQQRLRARIRNWLNTPLTVPFDPPAAGGKEPMTAVLFRQCFRPFLPATCARVTRCELLTVAGARLEAHAAFARLVDESDSESKELLHRLLGEDLASAAAFSDEVTLAYQRFKAFGAAVNALAAVGELPEGAMERHCQNLRFGPEILENARAAFTFAAPRSEWSSETQVIAPVLRNAARAFAAQILPLLPTPTERDRRAR